MTAITGMTATNVTTDASAMTVMIGTINIAVIVTMHGIGIAIVVEATTATAMTTIPSGIGTATTGAIMIATATTGIVTGAGLRITTVGGSATMTGTMIAAVTTGIGAANRTRSSVDRRPAPIAACGGNTRP